MTGLDEWAAVHRERVRERMRADAARRAEEQRRRVEEQKQADLDYWWHVGADLGFARPPDPDRVTVLRALAEVDGWVSVKTIRARTGIPVPATGSWFPAAWHQRGPKERWRITDRGRQTLAQIEERRAANAGAHEARLAAAATPRRRGPNRRPRNEGAARELAALRLLAATPDRPVDRATLAECLDTDPAPPFGAIPDEWVDETPGGWQITEAGLQAIARIDR